MNIVLDDYDGKIISGAERHINFLTFVLELGIDHGKKSQTRNRPDRGSNLGPLDDRQRRYSRSQRWFYFKLIQI